MADVKSLIEQAQLNVAAINDLEGAQLLAVCMNGKVYQCRGLKITGPVTVQEIPAEAFLSEVRRVAAKALPHKS